MLTLIEGFGQKFDDVAVLADLKYNDRIISFKTNVFHVTLQMISIPCVNVTLSNECALNAFLINEVSLAKSHLGR